MVNVTAAASVFAALCVLVLTVTVLYLTYSSLKQDVRLSTGSGGGAP